MTSCALVLFFRYRDNFYGVLLPDSPDWLAHSEYLEDAFIQARENGDKVR